MLASDIADLAQLVLAGADERVLASRLAAVPGAPELARVRELGERARRSRASEEETALALGVLVALGRGAR